MFSDSFCGGAMAGVLLRTAKRRDGLLFRWRLAVELIGGFGGLVTALGLGFVVCPWWFLKKKPRHYRIVGGKSPLNEYNNNTQWKEN